ncbi:MAG: hypothetical protein KGM16_14805 [Bacteroidota bacterium]|nr:hypothetical protein [Bacteroidota bacterium]
MKKILIILGLLNCICVVLPAQINRMNARTQQSRVIQQQAQPQYTQPHQAQQQVPQQQVQRQQVQLHTAEQQQGTTSRKPIPQMMNRSMVYPVPHKLNFMTFKRSLLKPGATDRLRVTNKITYTNRSNQIMSENMNMNVKSQGSTTMQQSMRQKIATNSFSSDRMNYKPMLMDVLYTVQKKFSDGHKASFILTNNTDTWATDFGYVKKIKDSVVDHSDPNWNCAYITQSVNAQSSSFMNASVNQKGTSLIPGTIYAFDDYAKGNFREFRDGRNPIVVWTPTNVGKDSFDIQNPNGQTISQGISNIVNQFSQTQGGASAYEHTIFSNNESDLNMLVSAGGSYSGFSGFGINKTNQGQHHIYVTLDAIKPLYTIMVQPPPDGYFADGKVPATSSPLVVVQNVTYGTRLLANIDIQTSTFTNYDSLHLAYTDGIDNGALDFSMLANNKSLTYTGNIMVVGTGINIPIVSGQNYQQQISNLLAQGNYRTAMPIQYQLTDLDGNILGVESVTDQFVVPECKPAEDIYTLKSVFFSLRNGADGKNDDSQFDLYIGLDDGSGNASSLIGAFEDKQTEYKAGSAVYSQPIPFTNLPNHPNAYTYNEFKNGGYIEFDLSCAAQLFKSDDWDIASGRVTFNFVSQKGVPYPGQTYVDIPNFRLSSSTNGFTTGKQVFWFDGNFKLR